MLHSKKRQPLMLKKSILCSITIILVLLFAMFYYNGNNLFLLNDDPIIEDNFSLTVLIDDHSLTPTAAAPEEFVPVFSNISAVTEMEDIRKYLFNIDQSAYVTIDDLPIEELVQMSMAADIYGAEPKVLIFHTHSQENFIDSEDHNPDESIVAVGRRLSEILANDYGISVVHDTGQYDIKDGKLQRGSSYETMEPAILNILQKYPSIEVTIDLHRDGVPDNVHLVTEIDGKDCAKIMFFNGITRYNKNGEPVEMPDLNNPYIKDNLAVSLQLFLTANEKYPGLARKIYIKPYRYSLHLKQRSMLIEVGANTNTLEEAMNAMVPLADILVDVLGQTKEDVLGQ